jgi:hypothetical protein
MSKENIWNKYKTLSRQGKKWEKRARNFKNKSIEMDETVYLKKQVQNSDM